MAAANCQSVAFLSHAVFVALFLQHRCSANCHPGSGHRRTAAMDSSVYSRLVAITTGRAGSGDRTNTSQRTTAVGTRYSTVVTSVPPTAVQPKQHLPPSKPGA